MNWLVSLLGLSLFAAMPAFAQAPRPGGTLNVGFASDSKTLDPIFSVQSTERQVLYLVFNTLVKFGTDFSIKPELAESWKVSDDGKQVVLKLRAGVKFHDGTPFDAASVKWNFDKRLDPKTASPQRELLDPVIAQITATDSTTVTIDLKKPYPGIMSLLGERPGFMVSPTAWEKDHDGFGGKPVGTGPFTFVEWVRGSQLVVAKNPAYWEPSLPYLDRIVFRDIGGSVVGVQRLITGELDFVQELSPQETRQLEPRQEIRLVPITVGRWYSLQFQVDKPPFDNPKLRQAIAAAVDRDRLNAIVMRGKGAISDSPTPPGLWWADASIRSTAHDPARAKALFKEAGYPDGIPAASALELSTPQIGVFQQINQLVQEQLQAVGVATKLVPASSSDWYAKLVDGSTNFSPNRWTQRPDPDGLLYILFHMNGFANTTHYKSAKVDALLERGRATYDQAERKRIYREMQQQVTDDLPMIPLFFSVEFAAMQTKVQNYEWIPDQIPRFREVWKAP